MLGDAPVIDAMVQSIGFNSPATLAVSTASGGSPTGTPWELPSEDYILDQERYQQQHTAEELLWLCFAESPTDIAVHHAPRRADADDHGASTWEIALRFRHLAGQERVRVTARLTDPVDHQRSIAELDEMIDLHGICGLGLDLNPWDADLRTPRGLVECEEVSHALIDHARERGLRAITFYMFGSVLDQVTRAGLARVVETFPDMSFDIVRAGADALEDAASLSDHPNLYINLAGTSSLLATEPRRFAGVLGTLLREGDSGRGIAERILWGTGVTAVHPRLLAELFWRFQMPDDLVQDHGYPEVTDQMKKDILAGNFARKISLDLEAAMAAIPDDPMRQATLAGDFARPWSKVPVRAAAVGRARAAHDAELHA